MVKYVTYKFQTCVCDHHGTKHLKEYVKEVLAPFKYPRWIVFTNKLPKTATGKIQRFKLRKKILNGRKNERKI